MSFYVAYIAKDKTRALAHLADLRRSTHYSNVPQHAWDFISDALVGIRQETPVSVTAQGHMVTADPQSYEVSTCTIEVKPLGTQFIE
jgi:hypothetical protein